MTCENKCFIIFYQPLNFCTKVWSISFYFCASLNSESPTPCKTVFNDFFLLKQEQQQEQAEEEVQEQEKVEVKSTRWQMAVVPPGICVITVNRDRS